MVLNQLIPCLANVCSNGSGFVLKSEANVNHVWLSKNVNAWSNIKILDKCYWDVSYVKTEWCDKPNLLIGLQFKSVAKLGFKRIVTIDKNVQFNTIVIYLNVMCETRNCVDRGGKCCDNVFAKFAIYLNAIQYIIHRVNLKYVVQIFNGRIQWHFV